MLPASVIILEYVCPTFGCILGNCMFAAPLRDVRAAVQRGSLGNLNPTPWSFMLGNCLGWVTYSFILQNLFIFFANAPGFVLSVYFNMCAVKLQYQDHHAREMRSSFVRFLESSRTSNQEHSQQHNAWQKTKDLGKVVVQVTSQQTPAPAGQEKLVVGMVFLWLIVISIISFGQSFTTNTRQLIVGFVVNANLLFFYGAPLSTIFQVVKTASSISIHIPTMVLNTLNGSFWTAYGFAVQDPFIYVPNGLGALLGVVQVCLCIVFPRRRSVVNADEEVAVQLETIMAEDAHAEDTVEEGLSPSSSHENVMIASNDALRRHEPSDGVENAKDGTPSS